KIDGKMDADLYCKILEDELQVTLEYYDKSPSDIIFQQDNDSKHTSEKAQTWFKNHGFQLLQWPAQSPDLNPIEHLWTHIKRSLENVKGLPIGCEMVFSLSHVVNCRGLPMIIMGIPLQFTIIIIIQEEWDKIKPGVCQNLIESMPKRSMQC